MFPVKPQGIHAKKDPFEKPSIAMTSLLVCTLHWAFFLRQVWLAPNKLQARHSVQSWARSEAYGSEGKIRCGFYGLRFVYLTCGKLYKKKSVSGLSCRGRKAAMVSACSALLCISKCYQCGTKCISDAFIFLHTTEFTLAIHSINWKQLLGRLRFRSKSFQVLRLVKSQCCPVLRILKSEVVVVV